jgi:GntR family transcriptional regulator
VNGGLDVAVIMTGMSRGRLGPDSATSLPATLSPTRPKGDQLRDVLARLAAELGPGRQIPSERFLADHFMVARGTVRQVIDRLVADGLLYRRPGNATFTAQPPVSPTDMITSFTADIRARGLVPSARLLDCAVLPACPPLCRRLALEPGDPVFRLERLRLVNGEPLAVERTNLPATRFAGIEDLDWESRSLHETLWERWRVRPERNESSISAQLPDPTDAARLGLTGNQPCLVIVSLASTSDGEPVEAGTSLYRADRHAVLARFHRPPGQPATTPPVSRAAAAAMAGPSDNHRPAVVHPSNTTGDSLTGMYQ